VKLELLSGHLIFQQNSICLALLLTVLGIGLIITGFIEEVSNILIINLHKFCITKIIFIQVTDKVDPTRGI
jgi:hypothetical protein